MGDVMATFNETGGFPVPAPRLAGLVALVRDGIVSHQAAKRVYGELVHASEEPRAVAERLGLVQVSDEGALAGWVDEVIAAHPGESLAFRGGGQAHGVFRWTGDEAKQGEGRSEGRAAGVGGKLMANS